MLISIDESGDFRADSNRPQVFVAAHVRPATLMRFYEWEKQMPRRYKDSRGEIKSSGLPEGPLNDFVNVVLFRDPRVRLTAVVVNPGRQPSGAIDHHRTYSLGALHDSELQMKVAGNLKGAASVAAMRNWLRRLSQPLYLKTISLAACVTHALRDAVIMATVGGYDQELGAIEYRIDRDFVRQSVQRNYVTQLVRTYGEAELRGNNAIPHVDSWDEKTHPFLLRYSSRLPNGQAVWNFTSLFRDRFQFVDSRGHPEIRIERPPENRHT